MAHLKEVVSSVPTGCWGEVLLKGRAVPAIDCGKEVLPDCSCESRKGRGWVDIATGKQMSRSSCSLEKGIQLHSEQCPMVCLESLRCA